MASVVMQKKFNKNKPSRFQLYVREGGLTKHTISFSSAYTEKQVREIKRYVEDLVRCRETGGELKKTTIAFVESASPKVKEKLVKAGLVEEKEVLNLKNLWEKAVEKIDVSDSTASTFHCAELNVLGYFGDDFDPTSINLELAESWRQALMEAGLSVSTVNLYARKLKQVLKTAVKYGWIEKCPLEGFNRLTESPADVEPIPLDVFLRLRDKAETTEFYALLTIAYKLGLRMPSEIKELKWIDVGVDFITITDKKHSRGGRTEIRTPYLFPEVKEALERLKMEVNPNPSDLIFPNFLSQTRCRAELISTLKSAGIKPWTLLWLRFRKTAEQNLRVNFNPEVVGRMLGHSAEVGTKHYAGRDLCLKLNLDKARNLQPAF